MPHDAKLTGRVREHLSQFPNLKIEEKRMFGGIAFMVNGKMCVNVSGQNLMCRFDPNQTEELAQRKGYLPVIMKGKEFKGYCYVEPAGFKNKKDFEYWITLCLNYNSEAKPSKKRAR